MTDSLWDRIGPTVVLHDVACLLNRASTKANRRTQCQEQRNMTTNTLEGTPHTELGLHAAALEPTGLGAALHRITALLSPAVLLTIRAAAACSTEFSVDQVASRLDVPPVRVLEWLQMALDSGIGVIDHGGGRFAFPGEIAAWLGASTLPSLVTA